MPQLQHEDRLDIERAQAVLQYLSEPENLITPESDLIRNIVSQYASDLLCDVLARHSSEK